MRKTISLVLAVLMMLVLLPAAKLSSAVAEATTVVDEITNSFIGVDGSTYTAWTDKTGDSGAVYAGKTAGGDTNSGACVQLRSKNSEEGIVTTASGGTARKIVVAWNNATSNTGNRQLDVYGKSTAYTSAASLYATENADQGTLLGSIVCGTDTELTIKGDYQFIGMRSKSGAMYLDAIDITWEVGGSTEPEPTTYIVSFNANGGTGTMEDVTTTSPYKLPECGFTAPENKEFSGWALEGVETIYNVNDNVELTGNVTFFAQWQEAEPEPETTAMELVTELADGDEVVIYYPDSSKVVTGKEYYFEHATDSSKNKWELVAGDATLTDGVLAAPQEALVLTVSTTVADDEETTLYTFKTADDKYLYADATDVKLVDTQNEYTLFQLETVENGFYIKCDSAVDANSNAIYIEYYKGYFTVYKMGTTAKYYTFQFYAEPGEGPEEPPVIEPTGDTVVLFTNDVHCQISDAPDKNGKSTSWGYAGLAKVKKDLEEAGATVILVDAGDHVQGGPIGSLTQGESIIDIMNFVGYDLAIPGNHEFDYGMDRLFELIDMADYPYLSANFMDLEANAPKLDAYKIIEANGKKIAFVGLSTPESITKSTPTYFMNEENTAYIYGFCQDETGAGVYEAAQAAIDAARETDGADYVIVVGHMGIDEQSSPWMSTEVIANISGADAFIDGHSHSVINNEVADKDGNPVLHGQTGTKLANIGKLTIAADGTLTMEILPVPEAVEEDPETGEFVDGIEEEFEALLNTVVAYTDHDLTTKDPDTGTRAVRRAETNLGDLCADAYRYMFDSDIAFVNGGGVRADINTGEIKFGQIINVHPFGNTAVLAEVTGQQILDALEMGARECPDENGGFLQVSGLTYEIHTYLPANVVVGTDKMWQGPADPEGEYRVQNVKVLDKETGEYLPLDLEKTYTLAGHNYMIKDMGDGFAMFGANANILIDSGKLDNQVLIDYIQSMDVSEAHTDAEGNPLPTVSGYTDPRGEGRIQVKTAAIILFTNDAHCQIDYAPMTFNDDGSVKSAGSWGYGRIAGLKAELEADGQSVILVDAGDHVQGGPIGSLTQGEAIIDIMNAVGYDLAIPGNHEFDYGMEQLFALMAQADYPYISANFVNLVENTPNGLVLDPYKIFEANGLKIAFVGLSTPESITKSTPTYFMNEENTAYIYGFCQDETGAGVYEAAQAAIDAAREEGGADYVIVVGHMGIDEQSSPWMSTEVIANISGADAFIDGHSHSVINNEVADKDGNTVLHGQTGTKLANVGKLTIRPDGTLTMEILSVNEAGAPDAAAQEVIDAINEEFAALLNSVVAYTDHLLTVNNPETGSRWVRNHETNLGDLCADAYRYMFDSDIAFVNGGGVRANINVGNIKFQDIINVHPFGNTAVLAEVTGQQILDALEMGARVYPKENGGFLQVSGLTYEINVNVEPNCVVDSDKMWQGPVDPELPYRVQNVMVMNKESGVYEPLDLEKTYTLAGHNYMIKDMGDGFAMFGSNANILIDSGKLDNQVLIDYIQSMDVDEAHTDADGNPLPTVSGYTAPEGEGRILIVEGALFYGEDVLSADVVEEIDDEEIFRYDIKVKDIDPETSVVGLQTYVQYDNSTLEFLEATSALEGSTGINVSKDGVISFAWASNDEGITIEDGTVVVSLYFKLKVAVEDGYTTVFTFVGGANGATTGYSYVDGDSVVEADQVTTKGGSITFDIPDSLTIYGEDVMSSDVMTIMDGVRVYRYDIRVKDLPEAGLKINSAQIFVECDEILELRGAEGMFDWTSSEKNGKLMYVWASETPVLLNNEDIVLTLYFAAPHAKGGDVANIRFTANMLNTVSAMSIVFGGEVVEIEADTVDGSITFADIALGDANCDGQVTAADAALILRSLVGLNELTAQGALNADVDGDGEITAEDAAIILRYIVKLIETFPVEG